MSYRNFRLISVFILTAALSFVFSGCGNSSVVSDSQRQSQPANATSTPSNPAPNAVSTPSNPAPNSVTAATPAPSAAAQAAPSPTMNPIIKQAQAQPGVPVAVPESMRRPLNKEEMEKALQQLPPEVRARIMGMQKLPAPSPQPAKK